MCHAVPGKNARVLAAQVCAVAVFVVAALANAIQPAPARACGCFTPPLPKPGMVDFAINQQAEHIIFEVEPDGQHITAHVLIRYAGDPEQFAWIVPVPSVPELDISYGSAFGFLDQQTQPTISPSVQNICPQPLYQCRQHTVPFCGSNGRGGFSGGSPLSPMGAAMAGAGGSGGSNAGLEPPGVMVFARAQVGSYDTVVFGAGDGAAAVTWLNTEGFIVNETMSPYMQPYLDDDMLFVAAKLIPGADADEIRPLRMRYEGNQPMIPLVLTAVAAEPHLTVTSYIYGATTFAPLDEPLFTGDDLGGDWLATYNGRTNYPMALARMIDEEGGHAFMLEFAGAPPRYMGQNGLGCCNSNGVDNCGIGNDQLCQCPLSSFDEADCADEQDLVSGLKLVEELATKYARMTRLTTRLSAEEMTYDPMFATSRDAALNGAVRISRVASQSVLMSCERDLIERDEYDAKHAVEACATVYCARGECVATEDGPGCVCDPGHLGRSFTDLDGKESITCVPEKAAVDLSAGGLDVPDVCDTLSALEQGTCVNLAGFPAMRCDAGHAAIAVPAGAMPSCSPVTHESGTSGARDYTVGYAEMRICAPAPPSCDARLGWLEPNAAPQRKSVESCKSSEPDPSWLEKPPAPVCPPSGSGTSGFGGPAAVPGSSGASATTGARPTTPMVQLDTTQPRGTAGSDGSKSKGSSGCSAQPLAGGFAALSWLPIALAYLVRSRRRR
jgi:hypothetical protein